MSRTYRPTGPDVRTRANLRARSGGYCEMNLAGCTGRATEVAHRIKRGAGGRHGEALERSNRLSNLIHACSDCHAWTHARPTEAYQLGLMLREHQNPADEPMPYRNEGWVLLTDDGGMWPAEHPPERGVA
jgi:hypothetical protein